MISSGQLETLPTHDMAILKKTVYVTTPSGIFVSNDMGDLWERGGELSVDQPELEPRAIAVDPHNAQHAYAGVSFAGLFTTYDGGKTWTPVKAFIGKEQDILAITTDGEVVVIATDRGLWISLDAGQTGKTFNAQPDISAPVLDLSIGQRRGFLMAMGKDGIGIADVDSEEWEPWMESPQFSSSIISVAVSGKDAQYASNDRVWYWDRHIEWWLWQLGGKTPCQGS
jgi:photosystem II stability/assembly factor-like uncharacterized protein